MSTLAPSENQESSIPTEAEIRALLTTDVLGGPDSDFLRKVLAFLDNPANSNEDFTSTTSLPHLSGEILAGHSFDLDYQEITPPKHISKIDFYLQEKFYQYWMKRTRKELSREPCYMVDLRYCMKFALSTAKNPLQSGYHYNGALVEALALEAEIEQKISGFSEIKIKTMTDAFGNTMTVRLKTKDIEL
jgi:hypothetical protein